MTPRSALACFALAAILLSAPGVRGSAAQPSLWYGDLHPDRTHPRYFGAEPSSDETTERLRAQFHVLRDQFVNRQAYDDNFTLHVYDMRGNEAKTLEVFVLERQKELFEETGQADWRSIDRIRRQHTRRLVDKYEDRGVPRRSISVKWGRSTQVLDAWKQEAPTVEYEIRLARLMGLSLLATEVGTVETFNVDSLISTDGARGRYQMMPYTLHQFNIKDYWLETASGRSVKVREELHPLLTMEPAFLWLKAYANAVGHEIPGLLAYHSGPGTVFGIYRIFLQEAKEFHRPGVTVEDAFIWALTEGYRLAARNSLLGSYGRGYVPSGYGALRAVEHMPIDPAQTIEAELVRLREGESVFLSDLLAALDDVPLRWPNDASPNGLYERFRHLNAHVDLPPPTKAGGVPEAGNMRLQRTQGRDVVRFFLPLGAAVALGENGLDIVDDEATVRFDENAFRLPAAAEITKWDRAYDDLVEEASRFGFSLELRSELGALKDRFSRLAEERPTEYRRRQLAVITHHERLWDFKGWERLAELAAARQIPGSGDFGAQ